jgi:hypothetical protein
MARQRYYSEDDPETGVTPSQLKRVGKTKQRAYMRFWFDQNFEDPAQETPYNGREGGYQYIWGGPYDARDELDKEFAELVPEKLIEQVADEVEQGGISEWAPGRNHPDHERAHEEYREEIEAGESAVRPALEPLLDAILERLASGTKAQFGDAWELTERQKILDRIVQLESKLRAQPTAHGGIGHNNPPHDDDDVGPEVRSEIAEASNAIRSELKQDQPAVERIANATARLHKVASWLVAKADAGLDAFVKSAGAASGAGAVAVAGSALSPSIRGMVLDLCTHVTQWLAHVVTSL